MSKRERSSAPSGDLQDVDTGVGGADDQAAKAGRLAGQGGGGSDTSELGLGGTGTGAGFTAGAASDLPEIDETERLGTGLETGGAALGSENNSATRVDTFNVPRSDDQRDGPEHRIDPRDRGDSARR